jgi:gliding motility-associated-like protein
MKKSLLTYCLLWVGLCVSYAQVSPDCSNAIPICSNVPITASVNGYGEDDFPGVAILGDDCLEPTSPDGSIESNSAWYRFKVGEDGQLGFNIKFENDDDWDFALFRAGDCSDLGDPVRCNFDVNENPSGYTGVGVNPDTGTQSVGYDGWLDVQAGEEYYLLINNFSGINSGFSMQFSGQIFVEYPNTALDCSVLDNLLGPDVFACEGETVTLNAFMPDAVSYNWYEVINGVDVEIVTNQNQDNFSTTTSGTFKVLVGRSGGQDTIESSVTVSFSQVPTAQPVSNISACDDAYNGIVTVDLSQKDTEALGTQDPNDFVVSYHATQADANMGINALPKNYENSSSPYQQDIYVRVTSAYNNNCYDASQQFEILVIESPFVQIHEEAYLCLGGSSVTIGDTSSIINPNYDYVWSTGETTPTIQATTEGSYTVTVTNTVGSTQCEIVQTIVVYGSEPPTIIDIEVNDLQDNNLVTILVEGSGDYEYQLGNSSWQDSNVFTNVPPGAYVVGVNDKNGCGYRTENILVIGFLRFFTPNGDGVNDVWTIEGLEALTEVKACIFDRFGKSIKELSPTNNSWDGTYRGKLMPSSDYWVRIEYIRLNNGQNVSGITTKHFSLKR